MGDKVRFEPMLASQKEAILKFMLDHFLPNEPLGRALNLPQDLEKAATNFRPLLEFVVDPQMSFVALNQADEIIGVCLNRDDSAPAPPKSDSKDEISELWQFLGILLAAKDGLLPPNEKRMECPIICVNANYCRKGIAQKLLQMSMENAKSKGFDSAWTICTAIASQIVFEKAGFETLKMAKHSEYLKNGKRVFVCNDGTDCAKLVYRKL